MAVASNSLITLKEARQHLRLPLDDRDPRLEVIVNGVALLMDSITGRTLKQTLHSNKYLTGDGTQFLSLPNWPIDPTYTMSILVSTTRDFDNATAEVFWNGNSGEDASTATVVVADEGAGILKRVSALWPKVPRCIKITYQAGHSSTDDYDLREAALLLVNWYWNNEGMDQNVKSMNMPGLTQSFSADGFPARALSILRAKSNLGMSPA